MATAPPSETRVARAAALKERIYLSFTSLAVLLTMAAHSEQSAMYTATTLFITAVGTLLTIFVADVLSHLVAHERFMTRAELRHATVTSLNAIGAIVLPLLFLGLAALDVWATGTAITAGIVALLFTLVVICWIAIRRIPLTWWQRAIALTAEAVLSLIVVGLKLLSHT